MRSWIAVVLAAGCGRFGFGEGPDGSVPGAGVFAIAANEYNTCAILDGALSCWGSNANGQLATATPAVGYEPIAIGADRDWILVVPGGQHICGVRGAGDLYCWGANTNGQLGVGDTQPRLTPTRVDLGRPVVQFDAWFHTCAVLDDGELWCWGDNDEGQLGQNDSQGAPDSLSPVPVGVGMQWSQVSAGQGHTLALANGALYGTGRNSSNELGIGGPVPGQLRAMTPIDSGYIGVIAGQNCSCAMRSDASVACWGDNGHGELGTGDMNPRGSPTIIATDQSDVDIDTFHTCALSAANTLSCSGRNVEGQLGTGNQVDQTSLTPSGTFDDWILLSIGRFHSCGMRSDHSVWCVGQNTMGQLGIGMSPNRSDWVRAL